jgi:hypothetical protein
MKVMGIRSVVLAAGLVAIIAVLAFNFAVVGKYATFPWWHQHDCDSDPLYVAQAITLVNDGPFDYIHHPGATVSCGHGAAYRLAAAVAGWHPEYLDLHQTAPELSAWEVLEDATQFSRRLAFVVFVVFITSFYGLIFWLTRNLAITFLVTFFVATAPVAVWHSRAIRPEIPSLLFSLLALWVVLTLGKNRARGVGGRFVVSAIGLGFLLAMAVLSKIQILPAAAALLLLGFVFVVSSGEDDTPDQTARRLRSSLFLGLAVAVLTPWWALDRPDFLTPASLDSIGYFDRLVYGSMIESFAPLTAGLLGLSLAGTVATMLYSRRRQESRAVERCARAFGFVHAVELGALLGAYSVVAPASRSFSTYVANTHHLLYGVIANSIGNVFGSGFLHHKTLDGNTVARIFGAHSLGDRVLGVNIGWLVLLVAAVVVARMVSAKTGRRGDYGLVILLLMIGGLMDIVFTLRWSAQFNYYAIFSLVFYAVGMALFLDLEWKGLWFERSRLRAAGWVAAVLLGLLLSHVGYRSYELMTASRSTAISEQTPGPMLDSSRAQNRHFWAMFE